MRGIKKNASTTSSVTRSTGKNLGSGHGGSYTVNLKAPGKVTELRFKVGDQVSEGEALIVVEEAAD